MSLPRYTGQVVMNYVVGEKLGEGGFGAVYRARHSDLDRQVAIKFLHAEHARRPEVVERFLREARLACSIGHPNIVEVENSGRLETGEPFYIMELVEGESLADIVKGTGPIPLEQLVDIFEPCVSALAAAHDRGVIHRDLKPHNIMVRREGGRVVGVKLLDFGIAKLLDHEDPSSVTGNMLGTPNYMAPEQADDAKSVDARADVYGLAATVYNAATGVKPFDRQPLSALLLALQRDPPPRVSDHVADAPGGLDRAIQRCMAKRPEQRPASVRQAWSSIVAALSGADLTVTTAPRAGSSADASTVSRDSQGEVTATSARVREALAASRRPRWPIAAVAVLAVAGASALWLWRSGAAESTPAAAPAVADGGVVIADAGAPDAGVPDAGAPDAAPPPPDAAAPGRRPKTKRRRPVAPAQPRVEEPPSPPALECGKPSFARVYNDASPARKDVMAALKRLRECLQRQDVTQSDYEKIQAALIARL